MKKLILTIGITSLVMVTNAQTSTNSHNPFVEIGQGLAALGSSTNWGFVGYGTIGNKTKLGTAKGGGILGIYNLDKFIGIGGGVDELMGLGSKGQTTIISANLQGQLPLQPLSLFWTNSFATSFTITPFLYSGLGTPLGSTISQSAVAHEGEGVNIDLFNFNSGSWTVGAGWARIERQNAGVYNGNYNNFFVTLHHPF